MQMGTSDSHSFHVVNDEVNCYISVSHLDQPLWRGVRDYGTLSIYRAEMDPVSNDSMAFIFVIENSNILITLEDPNNYRCNYAIFETAKVSYNSLILQLIAMIQKYVEDIVQADIEDRKFNGTYNLQ